MALDRAPWVLVRWRMGLIIDVVLIAGLIWAFARYNARTGILFSFLTVFVTVVLTVITAVVLAPARIGLWLLVPQLVYLAGCLTFINCTQPRQTLKIVGWYLGIKIVIAVLWALVSG